jgi:hypothetical protein
MNLFSWIRDGVREAVLLGVSDAVGDIGTPPSGEDLRPHLLQAMHNTNPPAVTDATQERPTRKKLGRSLEQIQAAKSA